MPNLYNFVIILSLVTSCYATTAGTRFQVVFMENLVDFPVDVPLEIHISNPEGNDASVQVSSPMTSCGSTSVNVPANSAVKVDICWWLRLVPDDHWPTYKTILVESDRNVMVYGYNRERFSGDGFFVLPTSELGFSYILASFGDANIATQFAISSILDDTTVQITLPAAVLDKVPVRVSYRGIVYTNGDSFTLTLTQFETYLGQSKGDLTGTRVLANQPIAVFSGNVRNKFATSSRDHLAVQLLATGDWGTEFAIAPVPRLTATGDLVRVFAKRSNTRFRITCESLTFTWTLFVPGSYYQFELTSACIITALNPSRKLQVVQMVKSQSAPRVEDVADPTMFLSVSRSQWLSRYVSPSLMTHTTGIPYDKNWVFVAIEDGQQSGLNIAGASASPQWTRINGVAMAWVSVSSGTNLLTHNTNRVFYAQVYGASDRESYGFALGADLTNSDCQERLMKRGDMIDNDCDGETDEETCNQVDDDGDGLIDEDCRPTAVEAVGNEYVIMFMENNVDDNPDAQSFLEIYMSAVDDSKNVNYTMTTENGTRTGNINPGEVEIIDQLPVELRQNGSGISTKAITIQASENVVVYGVNKQTFSTDAFLAFPTDVVGTEYYSAHYFPGTDLHQFAFTPVVNDSERTNVRVTMPSRVNSTARFGNRTVSAGDFIDVVIDYGQTAQFQSLTVNDDLNGAHIVSNKPISVFSGNVRARVEPSSTDSNSRDHLVQQLSPVSTWGQEYVTVPVPREIHRGDVFFITASVPNTQLNIKMQNESGMVQLSTETLQHAGDYVKVSISNEQYGHISADHPVQVYQYVKTTSNKEIDKADPSMLLVPPVQQWSRDYKFITPRTGQKDNSGQFKPFECFLMVAINKTYKDSLFFDGEPLPSNVTWVDLQNTDYTAAVVAVGPVRKKRHTLNHSDEDVFFQALMYGRENRESFGLPIGMKLATQECVLTSGQEGDGIDNDCDGSIDEELCNSIDDDADGEVDEDCGDGTSSGTSFFLTYMENTVDFPTFVDLELYVAVVGKQKATVNVRAPLVNFPMYDIKTQVQPGAVQPYAFTYRMRNEGQGIFDNTVFVRSDSNIVVYGVNKEKFSNDAFLVYPESSLGMDHYTCSWSPSTLPTQFAVVSTENDTEVTITLPNTGGNLAVEANNQLYNAGDSFTLTLKRFQVYQAQSAGDLTGTRIQVSHRAAVFSGNVRTKIELSGSRDHLVQQMLPTASYGNTFYVVPFPRRTVGDVLRIIAGSSTNTLVEVDGITIGSMARGGDYLQHQLPSGLPVVIKSTEPVMVVQFVKSQDGKDNPEMGDPAMFVVPSEDNFIISATFVTPIYSGGRIPGMDYTNYLTLVARAGQQANLKLDEKVLADDLWMPIANSGYVTTTQTIESGMAHSVVASDGSSFYGRLYGSADRESYAFPIGFKF